MFKTFKKGERKWEKFKKQHFKYFETELKQKDLTPAELTCNLRQNFHRSRKYLRFESTLRSVSKHGTNTATETHLLIRVQVLESVLGGKRAMDQM